MENFHTCLFVCWVVCVSWCTCEDKKTTCRSLFLPSSLWEGSNWIIAFTSVQIPYFIFIICLSDILEFITHFYFICMLSSDHTSFVIGILFLMVFCIYLYLMKKLFLVKLTLFLESYLQFGEKLLIWVT